MPRKPDYAFEWDDENFSIHGGEIAPHAKLPGGQIGAGIIYYSPQADLRHRLIESGENISAAKVEGLHCLWNTGDYSEILNLRGNPADYIRVTLKPAPDVTNEIPAELQGLGYAALLEETWSESFRQSVREDLDAIRGLVEALSNGQRPGTEVRELAALAKEDLDLKLLWSGREYFRHGVYTMAWVSTTAAAAPGTGLINVTVNTVDAGSSSVKGCYVWYVSRINHANPSRYKSFSRLSTPTSEYLAVGNYDMWTEKGGVTSGKRAVSVISAMAAQSVDLLAP